MDRNEEELFNYLSDRSRNCPTSLKLVRKNQSAAVSLANAFALMTRGYMRNTIVLHFVDGKVKKGTTDDFFPNKDVFHCMDKENNELLKISVNDLKAVFFVKNFDGDPKYSDRDDLERVGMGKKIKVSFKDGETLVGYTQGYSQLRSGFFLFPCDMKSNNDRVYVILAATDTVYFL